MYQQIIREELARQGHIGTDPRHIEGFMRLQYGCLDHLTRQDFRNEVKIGVDCIMAGGVAQAESLAESYGL